MVPFRGNTSRIHHRGPPTKYMLHLDLALPNPVSPSQCNKSGGGLGADTTPTAAPPPQQLQDEITERRHQPPPRKELQRHRLHLLENSHQKQLNTARALVHIRAQSLWQESMRPFLERLQRGPQGARCLLYGHQGQDLKDLQALALKLQTEVHHTLQLGGLLGPKTSRGSRAPLPTQVSQPQAALLKYLLIAIDPGSRSAHGTVFQMTQRACSQLATQGGLVIATTDLGHTPTMVKFLWRLRKCFQFLHFRVDPQSVHGFIEALGFKPETWAGLQSKGLKVAPLVWKQTVGRQVEEIRYARAVLEERTLWVAQELVRWGRPEGELDRLVKLAHSDPMLRQYLRSAVKSRPKDEMLLRIGDS